MGDPALAEKELSKGTRPEGVASEADASRKVRDMFTRIAPRYDLLNHLLSLQMDRMWRRRTARILRPIAQREDARILDLCCGTGDLAFALQRKAKGRVWGADFAHTMLVRAREKSASAQNEGANGWRIPFVESDALRLPFANGAFDLVTAAFGFRNLANYEAGLLEIGRVLKPAGTVAILEFTEPKQGWFGDLYRWYFRAVLPKLGGVISGDHAAYAYLPKSVARFLQSEELTELMQRSGFEKVQVRVWTAGTVALHTAVKHH
jgi:demethylmenaquinone methyltransferase/2-methoxy-6-polyprenyl-1,4-benzoquinol methylase